MRIGVLALQGAFREHIGSLQSLGVEAHAVRLPTQLSGLDGLVIPGGESTAIAKLMETYGFYEAIVENHREGMAVWGTCAGAILVANAVIDAIPGQRTLGILDIDVRRNAFGRQVDSFEAGLDFTDIGDSFRGVFIRAPWIERVGEGITVLASHAGHPVAARGSWVMATAFHPELTGDLRVHRYFIDQVVADPGQADRAKKGGE